MGRVWNLKTETSPSLTVVCIGLAGDGRFAPGSFDSLSAVELSNAIAATLNIRLPGTLIYDYPSVDTMVSHIAAQLGADASPAVPALSTLREGLTPLEGSTFQVRAESAARRPYIHSS